MIPCAIYRIVDHTPIRSPDGPQRCTDFGVNPGEILARGHILIEKPVG